ncbi:MAG: hypothetical protein K5787_03935 [Lentisphaeria bacterium]|nr:hypothetical protein [Lentisphaeria bacterium]
MRFEREAMSAAATAPDVRQPETLLPVPFHQCVGCAGYNLGNEAFDKPRDILLEDIDNVAQLHSDI